MLVSELLPVGLRGLALQIGQHAALALGGHDVYLHRTLAAEAPAAPDALVVLLKAVRGEQGDMAAVLPVHAPRANLRLGDEDAGLAVGESQHAVFLDLVGVVAAHLHGVRQQLLKQVALVVQVAPDQRRLTGVGNQCRDALAALLQRAAALLALLFQVSGRQREQHAFAQRARLNQVLALAQLRQHEAAVIEAKVGRPAHGASPAADPAPERHFGVALETPAVSAAHEAAARAAVVQVVLEEPVQHVHVTELPESFWTGMLPQLMRMFVGSDDAVTFEGQGQPGSEEQAKR